MSRPSLLVLALVLTLAPRIEGQSREDSVAVRGAAADYIEGWHTGDADRMAKALHPELVKRILASDTAGNAWIGAMGATELIRGTMMGGGKSAPPAAKRADIRILDIFQNAASVRIDAGGWIDYLHLVRWKGSWAILNVLWEIRRPAR